MGFSDEEAEAQRSEHACPGPPSVRIRIRHLASQWEGPLLTLPMAALLSGSADLASGLPLSAEFGSPPAELEPTASVPRRSGFWAGHRQAAEVVEKFAIPSPGRAGPDWASLAKRHLAVEAGRGREALPGPSMSCLGEEGGPAFAGQPLGAGQKSGLNQLKGLATTASPVRVPGQPGSCLASVRWP